jgi:predicted metal-dependent hydrolase
VNQTFFSGGVEAKIVWARQPKKRARCYRRLGCYRPSLNLISINPILDDLKVPDYFIEYIVYHEMLHVLYPPIKVGRRRMIHHKNFLDHERAFPLYKEAKAWELQEGKRHFF